MEMTLVVFLVSFCVKILFIIAIFLHTFFLYIDDFPQNRLFEQVVNFSFQGTVRNIYTDLSKVVKIVERI